MEDIIIDTDRTPEPSGEGSFLSGEASRPPSGAHEPAADAPPASIELAEVKRRLAEAERRLDLHRLLVDAGAIDAEAASALIERSIAGLDSPDLGGAVAELRRRKPALFARAVGAGSVMAGRAGSAIDHASEAAREAVETGSRGAVLDYMRARRAG